MRRTVTAVAGAAAAVALAVPSAHAATVKFEFDDVTFPDGRAGTIYASVKEMNKKDDNVYCQYQSSDHEYLGYYLEFVGDAPSDAASVLEFCLANYDMRTV